MSASERFRSVVIVDLKKAVCQPRPGGNPTLARRQMEEVLRLRMKGGLDAPARARAALASVPDLAGVEASVALLVSELVTNSVKHAAADLIELNLFSNPENV